MIIVRASYWWSVLDFSILVFYLLGNFIELHALANYSKSPSWWKDVGNLFQHSPYVFALWPIVTHVLGSRNISFNSCVGQDLILGPPALIPYWIACTSQLFQKPELMERCRQFISTNLSLWWHYYSTQMMLLTTVCQPATLLCAPM
jgi:hypothetical protein